MVCEGKARNKVLAIAVKQLLISLQTYMNVHGSSFRCLNRMASASAVSRALSVRPTDSFSAWLWMRTGRFKGRTCGTLHKKFDMKKHGIGLMGKASSKIYLFL